MPRVSCGGDPGCAAFIAEFERNLIRERTLAGLKAARARGRNWTSAREAQNQRYPGDQGTNECCRVAGTGYCRQIRRRAIDALSQAVL
jgi:hypothetical protein